MTRIEYLENCRNGTNKERGLGMFAECGTGRLYSVSASLHDISPRLAEKSLLISIFGKKLHNGEPVQ